jgi:hypothetical protein
VELLSGRWSSAAVTSAAVTAEAEAAAAARRVVGGASAVPSDARGVGCGVSDSTSAGLWWSRCRGGGCRLQ